MSDVWLWPEPYGRPSDDLSGRSGPPPSGGSGGPGGNGMTDGAGSEGARRRPATGALDVVGFDVQASDGSIGTIDEASYDVGAGRVVVDTGFWIFGRKRVIPAGMVVRVDPSERTVFVRCSRQDVRDAPDYDPALWDEEHRRRVGQHFGAG